MDSLPQIPSPGGRKNTFLLGKEKFWGGLVTAGLVILAGMIFYSIAPFILTLLGMAIAVIGKLIVLGALAVVVAVILAIALNPRTWELINYQYAILARKITKAMVRMDPVEVLRAYSHEFLERKLAIFVEKLTIVKQQVVKLLRLINDNKQRRDEAFDEAASLKQQSYDEGTKSWASEDDQNAFRLRSQEVMQRDASNERLTAQCDRLQLLEKVLTKFQRAFKYKIDEIQLWVEIYGSEYEALKGAAEAGQEAMSVVVPDEKKKIFDLTVETMRDDMAMFQGQFETALDLAGQMTSSMDIKGGAAEMKVMAALQQLDTNADALISAAEQKNNVLASRDAGKIVGMVTDRPKTAVIQPVDLRSTRKYGLRRGQ